MQNTQITNSGKTEVISHSQVSQKDLIYYKLQAEKNVAKRWLYDKILANEKFLLMVDELKSKLNLAQDFDIRTSHFGSGYLYKDLEKSFYQGMLIIEKQYFKYFPKENLAYSLQLVNLDLHATTNLYKLKYYSESWGILNKVYTFLSLQRKSSEIDSLMGACLKFLEIVWNDRMIFLPPKYLQDLGWYYLQQGDVHNALGLFSEQLKSKFSDSSYIGLMLAKLGKVNSYNTDADKVQISDFFTQSIDHTNRIADENQRNLQLSQVMTDRAIAELNLGNVFQAQEDLMEAKQKMEVYLDAMPQHKTDIETKLQMADIATCQVIATMEKLKNDQNLSLFQAGEVVANIVNSLDIYTALEEWTKVQQILELGDQFEYFCKEFCISQVLTLQLRKVLLQYSVYDARNGSADQTLNQFKFVIS